MTMDEQGSGSPARPVAPCLDPATLDQLLSLDDGGVGLITELLGLFEEDTPERLAGLRSAFDRGEAVQISELAHAMKGSAGTIGAAGMRAIALEIEQATKGGRLDPSLPQRFQLLDEAYGEACAALRAFIG